MVNRIDKIMATSEILIELLQERWQENKNMCSYLKEKEPGRIGTIEAMETHGSMLQNTIGQLMVLQNVIN